MADNEIEIIKEEISKEVIMKLPYTMDKVKKMNEMKNNLKRTNIHEENPSKDVYTFKIEPGCYNEISKK